jgi:hypothetical protein
MAIRSTYQNLEEYVRTYRGFVLAHWELACEQKTDLDKYDQNITLIADSRANPYDDRRRDTRKFHTRAVKFYYPLRDSIGDTDDYQPVTVEVGDCLTITIQDRGGDLDLDGRVLEIRGCTVFANVKIPLAGMPSFLLYAMMDTDFIGDLHFTPCSAVFSRQVNALESLQARRDTDTIRGEVLVVSPSRRGNNELQ